MGTPARSPTICSWVTACGGCRLCVGGQSHLCEALAGAWEEPKLRSVLSVGGMLAVVFTIVLGGGRLARLISPQYMPWITGGFLVVVLGFVAYKLGRRLTTVAELLRSFTLRGHWYLMPLIVVLLTIGSLLVVAASSPLIAPFIYTLF